jgi:hypothetical protein
MPKSKFEEFRQLVLAEESLQEELRAITDRKVFIDRLIELGIESDCEFTSDDVEEAMRISRRVWTEREI